MHQVDKPAVTLYSIIASPPHPPSVEPTSPPPLDCNDCAEPDLCFCGRCGSFGYCTWSCQAPTEASDPKPMCQWPEISCDECEAKGFGPDACNCGRCGSFGQCTFSCGEYDMNNPPKGPVCSKSNDD